MKQISRKRFIAALGTAAAGASIPALAQSNPELPDFDESGPEQYWDVVREMYALTNRRDYLNTAGLGPAPRSVLHIAERMRFELQGDAETGHKHFEPARETVASYLGADPDEIAFTRNATEGNSIIAGGLDLQEGDEVIFESHAHPGGSFPWLNQQNRKNIKVRVFEPSPDSAEENLDRIKALISSRTKVIQVSHITAPTGLLFPVAEIARLARRHGIWFHIDAAQSVGMIPVDVAKIGCDSLAVSGHKWIGGPHESGALFVRLDQLDRVALSQAGAYSDNGYSLPDEFNYGTTVSRFEYGTRDAASVVGLAEACRLQNRIGRERIAARGKMLATRAAEGLRELKGVEVLTPTAESLRASITTFRVRGISGMEVFRRLLSEHKLRCRPVTEQDIDAVRIAPHVFNTTRQIDDLVAAVRSVAGASA